ncbi:MULTISPECIES: TRAP transporter large permease subunit [unclassified Sporosarcina]|uniref:TRAP transporter large permease n=1 Tax=unclassified Sporosarcina TaxID=2647733 RepID=UPI000C170C82|nr:MULTISPECIES: TRAP transporter large permease subunit [unclassified Sporosarcina]PID07296.1 C4-dicarboxylate ABC transporter permease [Sporosarcina sp. P30]PID10492.1 C4-dicarboxylate ABC transporter permease [Sporosarcina sp. P31]PID13077.1 C4-dicarboxylate ABC transporter permease [Sporosarcina sp. P32b]
MILLFDYAPVAMFVLLMLLLFLGVPIAFALSTVGVVFSLMMWGLDSTSLLTSAVWGVMNNFTLIAIPLFILMSVLLEKSNIITDLYDAVYKWSGAVRGGLAIATILVGAIIGAISGVVAAGVIGLGLIALPQMMKYKYNESLSLGSIMAGGTLGQLIPPSLNMVVYGAITGVSVSSLFAGGLGAGFILIGLFIAYILFRAYKNKDMAPSLEKQDRATTREKLLATKSVILPLILIVIVLGSIFTGIATPTEGAAVGVLGTLLIGLFTKRLNLKKINLALKESTKMTGMVGWILIGAAAFSAVFSGVGGNRFVSEMAQLAPGGKWGILAFSLAFIILLGMFLETMALIMLAAPIISPIIANAGFDPLWWGVVFMVVLQLAYLTPPFGFAIFYLKSAVGDKVSIEKIYRATVPFIIIQLIATIIFVLFPTLATWLPNLLSSK